MTTRWADGFDDVASGVANFAPDYSASGTVNVVTGRRAGTTAMSTQSGILTRAIGGTETTIFQSIAIMPTAMPPSSNALMRFYENSILHIDLQLTPSGALAAYRGGSTLLGTSAACVTVGNWTWFQVKVVIGDSTGSVEIRDASGGVLLAVSGVDTRNAGTGYCDTVRLSGPGQTTAFDDWHVWDSTGSVCNTWTNDTRIDHKLPTGAGNSAQFTPSAGANYTCVDDPAWNTTDYVESATAGQKDSYTFGDLSHSPPNIYSVLVTALAQKDDAGARSLKPLTRTGGTDYAGAAGTLNQGSYTRVIDIRETDPGTGVAWTQSGVNAAEYGFENV